MRIKTYLKALTTHFCPINPLDIREGLSHTDTNEITVSGPLHVVCHCLGVAPAMQNCNTWIILNQHVNIFMEMSKYLHCPTLLYYPCGCFETYCSGVAFVFIPNSTEIYMSDHVTSHLTLVLCYKC